MEPQRRISFKIVVKKIEKPFSEDALDELDWICQSLGFFEPIDREKTAASIFKELVHSTDKGKPLTSSELAENVRMSRGSVMNHLGNMMRSGLIVRSGRYYVPRSRSLFRTIEEIEEDVERVFARMKKTAREIDKELGLIPLENQQERK